MPTLIVAPEQLPPGVLRTEIPTVVADRCEDACDLAVWRAIRWLLALGGRERLGIDARTIAAHAKVDVKTALRCINGDNPDSHAKQRPRHPKRGLVNLGLLEIAGHQGVGKLKPRPVYRIPRWIEEENARHTLALLARLGLAPPAPAPPPAQAALPLGPDPVVEQGAPGAREGDRSRGQPAPPADPKMDHAHRSGRTEQALLAALGRGDGRPDPFLEQADTLERHLPEPNSDQELTCVPFLAQTGVERSTFPDPDTDQALPAVPFLDQEARDTVFPHQHAVASFHLPPAPVPDLDHAAPSGLFSVDPDSEHGREGTREGGGDGHAPPAHTALPGRPDSQPGRPMGDHADTPPPLRHIGDAPPRSPAATLWSAHPQWVPGALPAHPRDLWRRACAARRPIDDDQLAALASEHDGPTDGHGWYWVGRAILAAALSEDVRGVAKVRRTMERWRAEDSYGSDAPAPRRASPAPGGTLLPPQASAPPARAGRPSMAARLGLANVFEEV